MNCLISLKVINIAFLFEHFQDLGNYMTDNIKKKITEELERQGVRYIDLGVTLQIMNDVKEWEEDDDGDLNDDYGEFLQLPFYS